MTAITTLATIATAFSLAYAVKARIELQKQKRISYLSRHSNRSIHGDGWTIIDCEYEEF